MNATICPNCDIEMDVKTVLKGENETAPMVICGICSYGWFIEEDVE
jgi:transcription elongation factor Elf1